MLGFILRSLILGCFLFWFIGFFISNILSSWILFGHSASIVNVIFAMSIYFLASFHSAFVFLEYIHILLAIVINFCFEFYTWKFLQVSLIGGRYNEVSSF